MLAAHPRDHRPAVVSHRLDVGDDAVREGQARLRIEQRGRLLEDRDARPAGVAGEHGERGQGAEAVADEDVGRHRHHRVDPLGQGGLAHLA
jgi:hypothetical protein